MKSITDLIEVEKLKAQQLLCYELLGSLNLDIEDKASIALRSKAKEYSDLIEKKEKRVSNKLK